MPGDDSMNLTITGKVFCYGYGDLLDCEQTVEISYCLEFVVVINFCRLLWSEGCIMRMYQVYKFSDTTCSHLPIMEEKFDYL